MQKHILKVKTITACFLVIATFVGGCYGVYYIMRAQCRNQLKEITSLSNRFYLSSEQMLFEDTEKLGDRRSPLGSYADDLSSIIDAPFFPYKAKNETSISSGIISLADSCLMLNAYDGGEALYSRLLMRPISCPQTAAETYATAELGLAKICAATERDFQAHEHVKSCLYYAKIAGERKYVGFTELILAEIQYNYGAYEGCASRISKLPLGNFADDVETVQKQTIPLLSLQALTEAQSLNFQAAEQHTASLIELSNKHKLDAVTAKHLDNLKLVYEQKEQPFPLALSEELLESYRRIAEKERKFVSEYALFQYLSFFQEKSSYNINFAVLCLALLIPVLFIIRLIVRLIIRSKTDPLTGLLNRVSFTQDCRIASRRRKKSAFIMFDVDDFKQINDSYGHKLWDAVLTRVAKEMYRQCSAYCRVYRIGGEEFAVIISNVHKCPPYSLAERVRSSVENLKWREPDLKVTLSAGVSTGQTQDLYHEADEMLYYSKSHGKNRIS